MPLPLDVNRYSFGASRLKLTDYLDNRNTTLSERSPVDMYSPNTLNNIRATNSFRYGLDEMGPGTPGEQRVPNQPPSQTPMPAPPPQGNQGESPLGNILQLASAFKGGMPDATPETIPGQQPGTDFSFGAVNDPSAGRPPELPTAATVGKQPDPYLLATILGAAGQAIGGRGTWQSRLGGNMAGIASQLYGEKRAEEREAARTQAKMPDVMLKRMKDVEELRKLQAYDPEFEKQYKQAQMSSFKDPKPFAIFWEDAQKRIDAGEITIPDAIKEWNSLDDKDKESLEMFEAKEQIKAKYKKQADENLKTFEEKEKIKAKYKTSEEKTPTPVTWTTATKQIEKRFGKQDAIGNIIITPELEHSHRIAQKKLVELKKSGNVEPLDAVNQAEDYAKHIEQRYWEYIDAAGGFGPFGKDRNKIKKVQDAYKKQYGYIPRIRR